MQPTVQVPRPHTVVLTPISFDAQSQKEVRKALLDAGLSKKNVDAWLSDVKTYNKTIKNTGLVEIPMGTTLREIITILAAVSVAASS